MSYDPPASDAAAALFEEARRTEGEDAAAALSLFAQCAAAEPGWSAPVVALGDLLQKSGRTAEALIAYGRAFELDPTDAAISVKSGNLRNETRDYATAVWDYETAAAARPDWYLPDLNRGNALAAQGNLGGAARAYDRALEKGGPAGIRLRRDLRLPIIPEGGEPYAAEYERYRVALGILEADPPTLGNPLTETPGSRFYLAYHGRNDRDLQERLAAIYLAGCPKLDWTAPHCRDSRRREGPRRIAFVSRFLFDHSIGRLCLGLFRRLAAHGDCEVICFETAPVPDDEVRGEIAKLVSHVETLPADIFSAREVIGAATPDVVFYPEIGMDPLAYFLAFARLAPIQAVSYGHPVTSGIPNVDYFLSCTAAEPAVDSDAGGAYSERLVPLGGLPFSYVRPPAPEPLGTRADFGLAEDATIYFLAQNLFKIHPDMDTALRLILERDPKGILLLLEGHDDAWGDVLRRRFAVTMGTCAARIKFLPRQSHDNFMRLLGLSDVSLDSFPFCGGNTTYQSLAMGTPVVTLPGHYLRGRVSLGIYRHMGMEELVARDAVDYAEIAVGLGRDAEFRAGIMQKIAKTCDVIFEDPVFLDDAERFLITSEPI
jgi:protein O-GlcNAc transferase